MLRSVIRSSTAVRRMYKYIFMPLFTRWGVIMTQKWTQNESANHLQDSQLHGYLPKPTTLACLHCRPQWLRAESSSGSSKKVRCCYADFASSVSNCGGVVIITGDSYNAGDILLEIETDKAQIDVEAQDDGKIAKIYVCVLGYLPPALIGPFILIV